VKANAGVGGWQAVTRRETGRASCPARLRREAMLAILLSFRDAGARAAPVHPAPHQARYGQFD
jgi:hypothetical protein